MHFRRLSRASEVPRPLRSLKGVTGYACHPYTSIRSSIGYGLRSDADLSFQEAIAFGSRVRSPVWALAALSIARTWDCCGLVVYQAESGVNVGGLLRVLLCSLLARRLTVFRRSAIY